MKLLVLIYLISSLNGIGQCYENLKIEIESKRLDFLKLYTSSENKDSILLLSEEFIFDIITNDIFNYWYNTKWDFNGTTTTPQKGSIACGYFVTTVLEHAGFKLPRVKWAQLDSETMILKLNSNVKRFSKRPVQEVINYIESSGKGLYLVGLDIHVGFIVNDGNEISFVHSNYYKPEIGVMKESLIGKNPLADSRYRVVGKILHKTMIEKWLLGNDL